MIKKKRLSKFSIALWIAAVGWIAVLFFFSGQTSAESNALSMRVLNFILRLLPAINCPTATLHLVLRKVAHFSIFAVEGFLMGLAMMSALNRIAAGGGLTALACGAMAALNEYHQSFSEGRSCEFRDMLIDSCGAITGVLVAGLVCHCMRRRVRRRQNVII